MKIELKEITVRELSNGYEDNDEGGVKYFWVPVTMEEWGKWHLK